MRKLFFILAGIISAGFALYFFACSTVDMFKMIVPGSASKAKQVKQVVINPLSPLRKAEVVPFQ